MTETSPTLAALLAWCSTTELRIDPRIHLVDNGELGDAKGICVYTGVQAIDPSTILVKIPKTAVLSVRSCSLSGKIPDVAPYGHGAQLALSLALYGEFLKGRDSPWFGYLQSLPSRPVGIALLWGAYPASNTPPSNSFDAEDGKLAQTWAAGTEIEKELQDGDGVCLLNDEYPSQKS